jgi:hypothetical protein
LQQILIQDLIDNMLLLNPADRSSATECLMHPYFWDETYGRQVLIDRLYKGEFKTELDNVTVLTITSQCGWDKELPPALLVWAKDMSRGAARNNKAPYDFQKLSHFTRFIGNFLKHDQELPKSVKQLFKSSSSYYYVAKRWPKLMIWLGSVLVQRQRNV